MNKNRFITQMEKKAGEFIEVVAWAISRETPEPLPDQRVVFVSTILAPDSVRVNGRLDFSNPRIARGISVMSMDEKIESCNCGYGLALARRYAVRRILGRTQDIRITARPAINRLLATGCPFVYHAELNPTLSFSERKTLLDRPDRWVGPEYSNFGLVVGGTKKGVRINCGGGGGGSFV